MAMTNNSIVKYYLNTCLQNVSLFLFLNVLFRKHFPRHLSIKVDFIPLKANEGTIVFAFGRSLKAFDPLIVPAGRTMVEF